MVSPLASAYDAVGITRSSYLGHTVPGVSFPGLAINASPDFVKNWPLWRTIRDCYDGEATIKDGGETYLRKLTAHKGKGEYEGFLARAYFYNAVRRTHEGLMGSLFRKPPEVTLPPPAANLDLTDVTLYSESFYQFAKMMGHELILLGRYGILVDLPDPDKGKVDREKPYMSGYTAECIYSWREILHRGRRIIDRVVLREYETSLDEYGTKDVPLIRVLRLDPDPLDDSKLVYSQEIIRAALDTNQPPIVERVPVTIRGRTLDYIPFVFCNVRGTRAGVDSPPLMDIATLNISHYQSTALLEHGRFYAGMPTYVVSAGTDGPTGEGAPNAEALAVGPSNVWELESGAKAWILEFNGHGLSFLENAVDSKQLQMQSLGGKLISSQRKAAALSSEAYALMEQGDEATLLDIAESSEAALAKALTYLADFQSIELTQNGNNAPIVVEMNKEFVRSDLTARELRAVQALYTAGLIPLDVLYYALRSVNVIPVEYSLEDFKGMLTAPDQLYKDPLLAQADADRKSREKIAQDDNKAAAELAREQARLDEQAAQKARTDARNNPSPRPVLSPKFGNQPPANSGPPE